MLFKKFLTTTISLSLALSQAAGMGLTKVYAAEEETSQDIIIVDPNAHGMGALPSGDNFLFQNDTEEVKEKFGIDCDESCDRYELYIWQDEEDIDKTLAEFTLLFPEVAKNEDFLKAEYNQFLIEKLGISNYYNYDNLFDKSPEHTALFDGSLTWEEVIDIAKAADFVTLPEGVKTVYNKDTGLYELEAGEGGGYIRLDIFEGMVGSAEDGSFKFNNDGQQVSLTPYEFSLRLLGMIDYFSDKAYYSNLSLKAASPAAPEEEEAEGGSGKTEEEKPAATVLNGDTNGDNDVTSEDATVVLVAYAGALNEDKALKAEDMPGGDYDGSGYVDSLDASAILLDYAEKLIEE